MNVFLHETFFVVCAVNQASCLYLPEFGIRKSL